MTRLQRWLAIASSIALLYALLEQMPAQVVALGVIYLIVFNYVVYDLTKAPLGSVVLHLFLLFFSVGHVLKTSVVLRNIDLYKAIGWNTVGSFDFSPAMMGQLFLTEAIGLLGAYLAFKSFFGSRSTRMIYAAPDVARPFRINPTVIIVVWFLFGIALIYLVQRLGFGRRGLLTPEESRLPFRLGGLLFYIRDVFLFGTGLVLFDALTQSAHRAKVTLFYILYTVVAFYFAFASLSRSAIAAALLPLGYVWLKRRKGKLSIGTGVRLAVVGLIVVYIAVSVTSYRVGLYGGETSISGDQLGRILQTLASFDSRELLLFSDFLLARIEGSRELMAVLAAPVSGVATFWQVFVSPDAAFDESIWGFSVETEGMAFGRSYGMLGLLGVSKSPLIVFLGAATYFWVLLAVERAVLRRGYVATSFFLSFVLFLSVWANMIWFYIARFTIILFLLYWFVVLVMEKSFQAAIYRVPSSKQRETLAHLAPSEA